MNLTFEEWAKYGWEQGWCSPPICQTCDGTPLTYEEELSFEQGWTDCVHIIRLYECEEDRTDATENHAPSQWRASNRGWIERGKEFQPADKQKLE
jgi:hypothetical protein